MISVTRLSCKICYSIILYPKTWLFWSNLCCEYIPYPPCGIWYGHIYHVQKQLNLWVYTTPAVWPMLWCILCLTSDLCWVYTRCTMLSMLGIYHAMWPMLWLCDMTAMWHLVGLWNIRHVTYMGLCHVLHMTYVAGIYHVRHFPFALAMYIYIYIWYARRMTHTLGVPYAHPVTYTAALWYARLWPKLWAYDMPVVWLILWVYDMPAVWPILWVYDMSAVWPILGVLDQNLYFYLPHQTIVWN